MQPACYNINGRQVLQIGTVHFRTYVSDVFLYLPDTFSAASFAPEQGYITGITLRIVCADQTEQCRLSGTVIATQCPFFAAKYRPVEIFQDGTFSVTDAYFVQIDNVFGVIQVIGIR